MIIVLARIDVAPGRRADFLAEFHRLMPLVHAEAGCLEYGPAMDATTDLSKQQRLGDDVAMIVEKWESLDHLKAHLVAPHMTGYRERVKDIVVGTQLFVLDPTADGRVTG
ncbi:MAG: putative quinol monooxygenase [Planctomycetaceae bacterium]|nr:putative quinol monooxygenase [Planctomycetaceae bacterium]